jgi:hypothetical protein
MTWGTGADEPEAPREDVPSRPVPPPFELPEGCGDGVVVPGQYDCFVPIDLEYLNDPTADHGGDPLSPGIDLDGDGREVVLWGQGAAGRLLWYDAENGFALGGPAPRADLYYASVYQWRSDWDGDGRPDLAAFPTMTHGVIEFSVSLDERSLGAWQTGADLLRRREVEEFSGVG